MPRQVCQGRVCGRGRTALLPPRQGWQRSTAFPPQRSPPQALSTSGEGSRSSRCRGSQRHPASRPRAAQAHRWWCNTASRGAEIGLSRSPSPQRSEQRLSSPADTDDGGSCRPASRIGNRGAAVEKPHPADSWGRIGAPWLPELWRDRAQPYQLYPPPPGHVLHVRPAQPHHRYMSDLLPGLRTTPPFWIRQEPR